MVDIFFKELKTPSLLMKRKVVKEASRNGR
jgi:hypothetical protein